MALMCPLTLHTSSPFIFDPVALTEIEHCGLQITRIFLLMTPVSLLATLSIVLQAAVIDSWPAMVGTKIQYKLRDMQTWYSITS